MYHDIMHILRSAPQKRCSWEALFEPKGETFTATIAGQRRDPMYFQKGMSRLHISKCFLSWSVALRNTSPQATAHTVMMEEVFNHFGWLKPLEQWWIKSWKPPSLPGSQCGNHALRCPFSTTLSSSSQGLPIAPPFKLEREWIFESKPQM